MPYINKLDRTAVNADPLDVPANAGELNYALTSVIEAFISNSCDDHGMAEANYELINTAVGALECCKLELYRRLAAPYENRKAKQNGDIPLYEQASQNYYLSLGSTEGII